MNNKTLIRTGTVGAIMAAVCCANPVLAVALGAVGQSAVATWMRCSYPPSPSALA